MKIGAYVVTRQYVFLNITYVSVQSSPSPPMVLMTRSAIPFRMPTRTTLMRILVKTRAPTTTFTPKNGLLFARISTASDNTSAQTASAQEHADAIQRENEQRTSECGALVLESKASQAYNQANRGPHCVKYPTQSMPRNHSQETMRKQPTLAQLLW